MPYKKTMNEMIKIIKVGTVAYKKGMPFVFKSVIKNDEVYSFDLQYSFDDSIKTFSFKKLYEDEAFDDDGVIFEKTDKVIINKMNNDETSTKNSKTSTSVVMAPSDEVISNYSDLKRFFFQYDKSKNCEFYQYTALENAISIIKSGFIMSRDSAINHIKYDNIDMIETTKNVIKTNYSHRTKKYARFYFNIRNKTTYTMKKSFQNGNTFGVVFAIDYSSIWKNNRVFITPISAHYSTDDDFEWTGPHCKDISNPKNLSNLKKSNFNFEKTFQEYEPDNNNDYQMAEILFYDKISIDCVSHLYFADIRDLNIFLSKLTADMRDIIQSKCVVYPYMHWR